MSNLTITIDTDNASFGTDPQEIGTEVARLLDIVVHKVMDSQTSGALRDSNGNTVGSFQYLPTRDATRLAATIIAHLRPSYDLVYVDRGDTLSADSVAAVVRGDDDIDPSGLLDEWESEQRVRSTQEILAEELGEAIRTWEREDGADYAALANAFMDTDQAQEVRDAIMERDESGWLTMLVNATGTVMLRITTPIDEDNDWDDASPADLLTVLGLPVDDANVAGMGSIMANAYEWVMGYWLVSVDLADVYRLPGDCERVTITNPALWLGNPMMGSGMVEHLHGSVTVNRADLRTDSDAWGTGWMKVAGVSASAYPGSITPEPTAVS